MIASCGLDLDCRKLIAEANDQVDLPTPDADVAMQQTRTATLQKSGGD